MRKAFGFTVLIFCSLLYVASCNQTITNKLYTYKAEAVPALRSDKWSYGDLYGMSYLPYFRAHYKKDSTVSPVKCQDSASVDLYTICDSYLWGFFASNKFYCNVNKLSIIRTNNQEKLTANLDRSKFNVLLIEFSERNVRGILGDTSYVNNIIKIPHENLNANSNDANTSNPAAGKGLNIEQSNTSSGGKIKSFFKSIQKIRSDVFDFIFNNKINPNIESNIWDISLFTPIKEFKSNMNYKLFDAVSNDVKVSKDGRQLFYNLTIDTSISTSSFNPLSDVEKDTLVSRLNRLYIKGKKSGFDKVYLSIIPNPVSILDPHYSGLKYNDLVNRIQTDKNLKVPFINVEPTFKQQKSAAYSPSDTHWSSEGAYTWLNMFNAELRKL